MEVRPAVTPDERRLVRSAADRAAVAELLARGVDPNVTAVSGWTTLGRACYIGAADVAGLLVEAGADINTPMGLAGDTPLILASWSGHLQLVRLLLDAGADLQAANKMGQTALYKAVLCGRAEVARTLLAAGARIEWTEWPGLEAE